MKTIDYFFIATAIPYVNDKPHLGHALLFIYGDVLARYYRRFSERVIFSVGTDEHGGKIAAAAANNAQTPQEFVDQLALTFHDILKYLSVSSTHFIRTTDEDHAQRVQYIWKKLQADGYIYKGTYEGWYCLGCEEHKTETIVKETKGICPSHQQPYEKLREENYFFKLTAWTKVLEDEIRSDRLRLIPDAAKAETLGLLKNAEDISISRPRTSLDWGIAVPGDPNQVIYVWMDALLNYITVLGYPEREDFSHYWPANTQVIGRDILRFHSIIWPALLLSLKLPLYKQLYVHGLITIDGQKMSKTIGNVINPIELSKQYGVDAVRYFCLRHLPSYDNGDYSHKRFRAVYNNELVDQLGNLVHRLQSLIDRRLDGVLPHQSKVGFSSDLARFYNQAVANCRFDQALNMIFAEVKNLNRFLEEKAPWQIEDRQEVALILDQAVVNLRQLNYWLQPFLPDLSARISAIFMQSKIGSPDRPLLEKIEEAVV